MKAFTFTTSWHNLKVTSIAFARHIYATLIQDPMLLVVIVLTVILLTVCKRVRPQGPYKITLISKTMT